MKISAEFVVIVISDLLLEMLKIMITMSFVVIILIAEPHYHLVNIRRVEPFSQDVRMTKETGYHQEDGTNGRRISLYNQIISPRKSKLPFTNWTFLILPI